MIKLVFTVVGAVVAAVYGGIIAAMIGGAVTVTTGDFLVNQPARTFEVLSGVLSGALAGGCLAYQGKTHKSYGYGLFTRVALVGSGLPLLRLGSHQNHWPTAIVFWVLGASLFLIGCFLILDIALQIAGVAGQMPWLAAPAKWPAEAGALRLMTFTPVGLALLLFGAYLTGGTEFTCRRLEPERIDCILEVYRWLGLVRVQETALTDVQGWTSELGEVILTTGSGQMTLPDNLDDSFSMMNSLDVFLASTRPTLRLRSEPQFVFFGFCLVAGLLVWLGFLSDPITAPPERYRSRRKKVQSFESPVLVFGLTLCLVGPAIFLLFAPAVQANISEDGAPVLNATTLPDSPTDTEAFIEGYISESNETIFRNFVIYKLDRYSDGNWQFYEQRTPPFWLDLAGEGRAIDRRLRVINDTYAPDAFNNAPVEWQSDQEVDDEQLRYRGFTRGNRVTIFGQVKQTEGEPQFWAWWLYGDSIEAYFEDGYAKLRLIKIVGTLISIAGVSLLAIFGYKLADF
jgi:hypothetical protein